jgi:hypothetical protein
MFSHPETMFLLAIETQRAAIADAERLHQVRAARRHRRAERRAARQAKRQQPGRPGRLATAGTLAACAPAGASAR